MKIDYSTNHQSNHLFLANLAFSLLQKSDFLTNIIILKSKNLLAFPVSGMVTIPVSMYQTVVTNMGDGVPVTMQAVCSSDSGTTNAGSTVIQVESGQHQTQLANSNEHHTNSNQKVILIKS